MITTTKEIIKELSEELDLPEEMVKENVKYLIGRLRDVMQQENVLEIRLSDKLGIMFCNRHTITHRRASIGYEIRRYTRTDKFKKIYDRLNSKYNFIMSNRHERLYMSHSNSYQRPIIKVKRFYDGMTQKEVQDYQNKKYNENNKRIKSDR